MSGGVSHAVSTATRIRFRLPGSASSVFETSDPDEIRGFSATLTTNPPTGSFCVCAGTLLVELENCAIATLELHHGDSIRWGASNGNRQLVTPLDSMAWLSRHGMSIVRESFDEALAADVAALDLRTRWLNALPMSLRPFFDAMARSSSLRTEWAAALAAEFPDEIRRAEVLLELFASGAGPWSGYSAWEGVPAQLLEATPTAVLVSAIGDATNAKRDRGALRLLASWSFRKRREDLRKELSPEVLDQLRVHALALEDSDQSSQALAALGF